MTTFVLNTESKDRNLDRLIRFVHAWDFRYPLEVVCERFVMGRTMQQNKALFGHAYKILRGETGHTVDELHDFFCRRFFGEVEVEMFGRIVSKPARTTTTDEHGRRNVLKWDRFKEFVDEVQQFAATELNVIIPDPDPEWRKHQQAEAA